MSMRRTISASKHHSGGFSLVELMVALVITLVLVAGIGQIFLGSKKSFNIQDSLGRMQENGRYATVNIIKDLRRAGYWGGNNDITNIIGTEGLYTTTLTACNPANHDWGRMLGNRIYGLDDDPSSYACIPAEYVRGDVLVVRYAAPYVVGGITMPLPGSITIASEYPNRTFIRSSLFRGRIFTGSDSEDVENALLAPAVRTAELVAHGYYIRTSTNSDASKCTGSGSVPSLYRITLASDGTLGHEEVAYGVDDLQVQYGWDSSPPANPSIPPSVDTWGDADAVPDWGEVIAARFWLLVRAECPETGFTNDTTYTMAGTDYTYSDNYRRQLYTATVNLRNNR